MGFDARAIENAHPQVIWSFHERPTL
jgi:hypothetical protein